MSWDPVGSYLATQSDDKSVIVWRTEDWRIAAKITDPFKKSLAGPFSLRLAWCVRHSLGCTGDAGRAPAMRALSEEGTTCSDAALNHFRS